MVEETQATVDGRNQVEQTQTMTNENRKLAEADGETHYCVACNQWIHSDEALKEHEEGVGHMLMQQQAQTKEKLQTQATVPKERARPLDQGLSDTCTLHAIANATVESLMGKDIDVKLDEVLGALKQADYVKVHGGNKVEDFHGAVMKRMGDKKTGMSVDVDLTVGKYTDLQELEQISEHQGKIKFVLSYLTKNQVLHCVYIEKLVDIGGKKKFLCINSWGEFEENPVVPCDQPGNKVYGVVARWKDSRSSATSESSEQGLLSALSKWWSH